MHTNMKKYTIFVKIVLYYITPSGDTVQQHQCGKQSIAGDKLCTVYSAKQLRNPAKLQIY